jgi:hypothetical protein
MCKLFTNILRYVSFLMVIFAGNERKPLIAQIIHVHLCTAMSSDYSTLTLGKVETKYSEINSTRLLTLSDLELGKLCKAGDK